LILVPDVVSPIVVAIYAPAVFVGIIVALIGLFGISIEKNDLHVLILTDIVGIAMLIIVAAIGTDLAESLVLPGLVVELAEILAICEILMSREMRKSGKSVALIPTPLNFDMEVLQTAPVFIAIILVIYGAFSLDLLEEQLPEEGYSSTSCPLQSEACHQVSGKVLQEHQVLLGVYG